MMTLRQFFLISLILFQYIGFSVQENSALAGTNCQPIFADINSTGVGNGEKSYLFYDYLSNASNSTFCLLSWLSKWDEQTGNQNSFADKYFGWEANSQQNPQTFRQLQVVVGMLRSLADDDFYTAQKSIENLPSSDASRAMNILGWMSKSQDKSLRINSTLFLGNAITSNGACAYFSHLDPLVNASNNSDLRARANILAVGGVFADRTDVNAPDYLRQYAIKIEGVIRVSGGGESYSNTIKSTRRIITSTNSPGVVDTTNEAECAQYLDPRRFIQ